MNRRDGSAGPGIRAGRGGSAAGQHAQKHLAREPKMLTLFFWWSSIWLAWRTEYLGSTVEPNFVSVRFFPAETPGWLFGVSQAFLEELLVAEREKVCAQVVSVPTGMQALVDLLDDR